MTNPTSPNLLPFVGRGNLIVETSGGGIRVNGHSGDEVLVEMYVKVNGGWSLFGSDDDDVEDALENYSIDIRQDGSTIRATAQKRGF